MLLNDEGIHCLAVRFGSGGLHLKLMSPGSVADDDLVGTIRLDIRLHVKRSTVSCKLIDGQLLVLLRRTKIDNTAFNLKM